MSGVLHCPPELYRGSVEGSESGPCTARIDVRRLPGGCVGFDYEAVGAAGLQHVEHTVAAPGLLLVVQSEAGGVSIFDEVEEGVFEGPRGGPYARRLAVAWDGTTLTWAWHWAAAGDEPEERSRAEVRLAQC